MRYVVDSWARASHDAHSSQHYLSKQGPPCSEALWRRLFEAEQKRVLDRARCVVFANPEKPVQILGYAIGEPGETPVLWYTQVRKEAWRKGVCKALLAEFGITTDGKCIYATASPVFRFLKRPAWTHVPWYLIPEKDQP